LVKLRLVKPGAFLGHSVESLNYRMELFAWSCV